VHLKRDGETEKEKGRGGRDREREREKETQGKRKEWPKRSLKGWKSRENGGERY
jgi:hypothetical protein